MNSEKPKFAYVIIHPPLSSVRALDTIHREKKICSDNGVISFYASYRDLYYKKKYDGMMWGVVFTTAVLKRCKEANHHVKRDCYEHNGLMSCKVYIEEFWFPDLCDTGYNLLNLTPEELYSGRKVGSEMLCEKS